MSFGFSVGDIIVVGKICYRQYTAATTGRKDASKELQELGNVLFSLNCALDHLSRTAKDVLARANSQPNPDDARETRIKLDRMINSCAETLKELDEATKKHRDTDANSQSGHASLATSVSAPGRLQKLRRSATTQWNKISWDLLSESLGSYRRKLEGHTAAINMVLLTFIWSATDRIEMNGEKAMQKMQALQTKALDANTQMLGLVRDMHRMMLGSAASSAGKSPNSNG